MSTLSSLNDLKMSRIFSFLVEKLFINLLQFRQGFFHAPQGFFEVLFTGGIRKSQIIILSECCAGHQGEVTLIQEVHAEVCSAMYLLIPMFFSKIIRDLRVNVKGSLRHVAFQPGYFPQSV